MSKFFGKAVSSGGKVAGFAVGGLFCSSLLTCVMFSNAFAASLDVQASGSPRGASFDLGNVDSRSYDGVGFNAFSPFSPYVGSDILKFDSFLGGALGTSHEVFLLSEVAHYDGYKIPGVGDAFGFLDESDNFISALPKEFTPGDSAVVNQSAGDELRFALNSPEGMFSSKDAENSDGAAHIIGKVVEVAGTVTIPNADLYGNSLTFDLQIGDIILFLEDLLLTGNDLYGGMNTDSDFNDLVVLVRSQPLPEPTTTAMLILAGAAAGIKSRRRRV